MSLHALPIKDLKYIILALGLDELLKDESLEAGATQMKGMLADSEVYEHADDQAEAEKALARLIDRCELVMNKLTDGEYTDLRKIKYGTT